MILYSGYGSENEIKLYILGDGQQKQINIDLSKPPFDHSFQGNYPVKAYAKNEGTIASTPTVSIAGAILTLEYPEPVPLPNEGTLSPRSQLQIFLFFPATVVTRHSS
jgi:hypothetical protein